MIKLTKRQEKIIERKRKKYPAEVSFFELLNACDAYDNGGRDELGK